MLVTSLSIRHDSTLNNVLLNGAAIRFTPRLPPRFDQEAIMRLPKSYVFGPLPKDYCAVRVSVTARSEHEAVEKAFDAVDLLRGIWNLGLNRSRGLSCRSGNRRPMNLILPGLAVGNPLGVGQTVTMGLVSAKGRQTGISTGSFEDFIQTDAAINRGNSGGALVNTGGELIGINSQILSPTGGSIGLGFSIPSNMARNVMDQLTRTGKVRRGQLGILVQKVSTDIASSLDLKEARGVIISQVQPASAAERAGLKQGDIITTLNGVAVDTPNEFRNRIEPLRQGQRCGLRFCVTIANSN